MVSKKSADGDERSLIEEQTKNMRLKNEKLEIELALQRGELVPVGSVTKEWSKMAMSMKNRMLSIPTVLAAELADTAEAEECEDLVRSQIEEALKELSERK